MVIWCLNGRSFECNVSVKNFLAMAEAVTEGHAEVNLTVAVRNTVMSMRRVDIERTMRESISDTLRPPPLPEMDVTPGT